MSFTTAPHFDLPFRFSGGKAVEVEQDTDEDIYNCVWAALVTPEGFRPEVPDFGMPDLTFMNQPIDSAFVMQRILASEPRATIVLDEHPDAFDVLIAKLTVNVESGGTP